MASIPLLCNICPKDPKFSDISHLLTHVGSKGHLSHYFKLQVRSRQEPAAREQLDAYDRWYQDNDLEKRLSERMVLKDSKNAINREKAASDKSALKKSSRALRGKRDKPAKTEPNPVLDPQLSRQQPPSPMLSGEDQLAPAFDAALKHRLHIPRMQLWPTPTRPKSEQVGFHFSVPPTQSKMATTPDVAHSPRITEYDETVTSSPVQSFYPDPPLIMEEPYLGGPSTTSYFAGYDNTESKMDPTAEDHKMDLMADEHVPEVVEDEVGGNNKLKGVCWPGMAIFDSASPDAKRKRNQKKDGSILEQMEHNAAMVEPIELIFTPHGDFQRSRIITGRVEDSSPFKEETPRPKRCCSKSKAFVLSELSTNNPRETRGKRALKTAIRQQRDHTFDLGNMSQRALTAFDSSPGIASTKTEGCYFTSIADEDTEWRLTFGDPKRERKRGIVVYDDNISHQPRMPAHIDGRAQAYPFVQHTGYSQHGPPHNQGMPLLTSGFHPSASMVGHSNAEGARTLRGPNVAYHRPVPAYLGRRANKENIEPVLDRSGRIDDAASSINGERRTQRYFSVEGSHTPHFFHALPPHMEFGAFQDSDFYGQSFNPLTLSYQQQTSAAYRHSPPPFTRRQATAAVVPLRKTTKADAVESIGQGYLRDDAGDETEDDNGRILFDDEAGWSS
ncbi:MAG: hypothetical protein FRX48_07451 [Lasallia pustulata]|uniref:Uncharacterized protein n=1 Tax=Lasallia pustulata TaxID=136370 RepID=A0A5M8PI88_9LECA|nr:MAG: hypothetical protein FRX48_07451 [Lasallia pustulata]